MCIRDRIIGVPAFAVIYRLVSAYVSNNLKKKDLSPRTEDYMELDHINEEDKIYIGRDGAE